MKRWSGWLVVLAAACGSRAHPASTPTTHNPNLPAAPNATVLHDVDGDTIDVRIRGSTERVRLIGIDTPETKKPNTPVQCYGPEATAFTAQQLPAGTAVVLVRDQEARDDYGRLLAYVYRAPDGLFVNLELAARGFARPLTIAPNDAHAGEFVAAAQAAEAADLGLWGACSG
jgi:micrococcal nuclease